jgi:glycolate oxidase
MQSSLEYFVSLLGEENVLRPGVTKEEKMQDYLKDMADYPSEPLMVLRPESTEQVARIVAWVNETKTAIVARGAGTSLTGASSAHGAVVVDFTRMKKIVKIDPVNWYAHVEAGVVLEDLNEELKKFGFFFPPDPGSTPWCTVGGAIAENSGGMKCFRYGTVKDWVLSVKVILANGATVKFGEPLPKNRVGYDFVHLMCGSEGTLGLITEAWVKITPLPVKNENHKRLLVFFDDWTSAGRAIQKLREDRIQPILLEFMDRDTMHSVNEAFELGVPEGEAILFIETDSRLKDLLKICEECGSSGNYIAKDEADEERLYNARMLNYMGLKALSMSIHTEDVVVPIDKLVDYLQFVKQISKKYGLRIPTGGHAGDGNVHPSILFDDSTKDIADKAFADICNYAIEVGGSVTGEHGVGEQKISFAEAQLRKSNGKEVLDLMRLLKKQWDPNNILNPGKFFRLDDS